MTVRSLWLASSNALGAARVALTPVALMIALSAIAVFCAAGTAQAQNGATLDNGLGMDLHLFRPAIDSKGLFTVNGTDILGDGDISFGLVLDAGFGILPYDGFENNSTVMAANAVRTDRVADVFLTGTLQFNYGIANWLVVGAQIPIQVVAGPNITAPGVYNSPGTNGLGYQGLGGITLHTKLRLTRVERDPLGIAALLHVELPTGTPDAFAGDGFTIWPVAAFEFRPVRQIRLALNVGARFNFGDPATFRVGGRSDPGPDPMTAMTGTAQFPVQSAAGTDLTYGHQLTFGLGASFRVAEALDIVIEGYGGQLLGSFGEEHALNLEAIGGLKIFVERNSYLFLGGGAGIPLGGYRQADVRATLGFIFEPSIGDRDGDGYKDDNDQCPDEPEDFDNFADEDGCPDPDNDRDGILDVDDECPNVPEDRDGDADDDGCPEGNEGDRDGDGILDDVDECPDDPEDRDGFQDEDGCPDPDNDQDGILDVDDLCPNDPEDIDNFEDEDGCPDPDNDQDRILDVDDGCPNDPETYNGYQDEDGCPDVGDVLVEGDTIVILRKVHFATDSAEILPRSFPILDAVAATLNGNPHIELIEVQGHADERSSDEYNIRLTRDRAASVVEALVQRGISRQRTRSGGYGERCPLNPQHNAAAWEENRRVEFKIIRTTTGPTGVEVACPAGRELIPR